MPIIQSVQRALGILDLFDEQHMEIKITDISHRMGLHKSTVHSLLKTLQEQRYIEQNAENGKYRLGMKLLERSSQLMQSLDINRVAKAVLTDIASRTGQTVHLVIRDGREGVYIDKVEGEKAVIRYSRVGRRIPLHCSAVGKILSAFQPVNQLKKLLAGYTFKLQTEKTIGNEADFLAELDLVRSNGFAEDNEENDQGVRCIAIAIRDHTGEVIASVSMSMLAARVSQEEITGYQELMLAKGEELSRLMGYALVNKQ